MSLHVEKRNAVPESPLLEVSGLSKAYDSTVALNDVHLEISSSEIHGLLGQNGSGKSTLIKTLAGVVSPDAGRMKLRGKEITLPLTAAESERLGLRFVHQNLGLVDSLSVGENFTLSRFAMGHRPINWRSLFSEVAAALDNFGIRVDPRVILGRLTPLEKAQVAIARAVSSLGTTEGSVEQAVLVLDEPTVYLPRNEVGGLFELLDRVVGAGHGVLLVTHRLEELLDHTDRVSILRDARIVDTLRTAKTTEEEMVELAVGSGWRTDQPPIAAQINGGSPKAPQTEVRGLQTPDLRGLNLSFRCGEIHGFTGLAGTGYEQILYALFGAGEHVAGTLAQGEDEIDLAHLTPAKAIDMGIALVPVDRLVHGLAGTATIEESLSLPVARRYFRSGFLRLAQARLASDQLITAYGIVCGSNDARIDTLSGGNQQKVLIAKWLQQQPKLLLLHEPSQGVDVRARHDIWQFVRSAAATAPVLVASSDYGELADLCTSVSIVAGGRIHKTLTGANLSSDIIAAECLKGPDHDRTTDREGSAP